MTEHAGTTRADKPTHPARPKIIYIGGVGRSGSTILGSQLEQNGLGFAAGEVVFSLSSKRPEVPCSCGTSYADCTVWSNVASKSKPAAVVESLEGPGPSLILGGLALLSTRLAHRAARILVQRSPLYSDANLELFEHISEATGASCIIDASKRPVRALLLAHVFDPGHFQVIHLTRDPAELSRSRANDLRRTGFSKYGKRMWLSHLEWTVKHAMMLSFFEKGEATLIRYEDFVSEPRREIERLLSVGSTTASGLTGHQIGGNQLALERAGSVEDRSANQAREARRPARLWPRRLGIRSRLGY